MWKKVKTKSFYWLLKITEKRLHKIKDDDNFGDQGGMPFLPKRSLPNFKLLMSGGTISTAK